MIGAISLIPRRTFFENAHAMDPRLSPDGRWLAWLAAADGVMNVWAAPRDDLSKARPLTWQTERPILTHWFARTSAHVLFKKDQDGDENFNLWCVAIDGAPARNLTPYPGVHAILLGMHYDDPHLIAVGINDRDVHWHDLYVVDIRTGDRRLLYENTDEIGSFLPDAPSFILDCGLNLKLATTTRGRGSGSAILKWNGADFEEIISIEAADVLATQPLHVNRSADAWFLLSSIGRDKAVILRVDWATNAQTLIASHDSVDISHWATEPRTREVTAFSVSYIRDAWIAIDHATGRDLARLEHELDAVIEIASQSDDDALWVVGAARPDHPPTWYLLDRRSGEITFLFSSRPKLDKVKLAPMYGAVIASRDDLELISYLTLPVAENGTRPAAPLPTVLLVHGGPWSRDGWQYNREVQWLANRGYAVLQVNYRGSTGFGKAFTNAGDREWAGKMHDDLIDAINWSIAEGIADPKRIAIHGASYGGYAAFVGATFTPDVFCCSVPIVGITNLETLLANPPPYWASFYETECHRIGDPRTPDGIALLRARSPLHHAGNIKIPMLIVHGANDVRCKVAESNQIVAKMTEKRIPVIYVVFPDEGHGLARPENSLAFRAMMEAFLAHHLGGRAEPVGCALEGSSYEIWAGREIFQNISVGL